jgi:Bacterial Ig domain
MRFDVLRAALLLGTWLALAVSTAPPVLAQSSGWQPGPGAVQDNMYEGFIDQPTSGATVPGSGSFPLGGWFVDTTAQGWAGADDVQVWLGTMEGGGSMVAHAQFAQSRPDVATALANPFWEPSGFSAVVPGSAIPAGGQTLNLYVHTPGNGWWLTSVNVTGGGSGAAAAPAPALAGGPPQVSVSSPTEGQDVSAAGSVTFTITGKATDPANGAGAIDSVDVWIFGERDGRGGTQLGTVQVGSDGSWSLTFKPTRFPSTHTNIYVYAHSKATGQTTEIVRGFNIKG